MTTTLNYFTLDVFTDRPFSGNPLAVFPQAEGLPDGLLQQLARELNLSETVFVGRPTAPDRFPVRIFTPAHELPFAGHPTVGTALLLAELGYLRDDAGESREIVLEEGVGPVPVTLDGPLGARRARFRTAVLPQVSASVLGRADAALLLGLETDRLVAEPVVASCGVPFQLLELDHAESLARVSLDLAAWRERLARGEAAALYCFTRRGTDADIRARMFAPAMNIPEDPATGAAAAALAGYLGARQQGPGRWPMTIEQGIEMGRPSRILTEARRDEEGVTEVSVAGQAVLTGEGNFRLGRALG